MAPISCAARAAAFSAVRSQPRPGPQVFFITEALVSSSRPCLKPLSGLVTPSHVLSLLQDALAPTGESGAQTALKRLAALVPHLAESNVLADGSGGEIQTLIIRAAIHPRINYGY